MNIRIITIGDEILLGQIVDTNATWMAEAVRAIGGRVVSKHTVQDEEVDIRKAIKQGFEEADVLLMTGGLGPTRDDVTKKAIAAFYEVGFVFSQETHDRIARMFEKFGRPMLDAHRQQCLMPQNAELLTNKMGSAPAMWFESGQGVLVSMPGVPYEMKYLMEHEVLPKLKDHFHPQPVSYRTIQTAGKGESQLAEQLEFFENNLPEGISLAYLPRLGRVRLRLTANAGSEEEQRAKLASTGDEMISLLGTDVFGEGTSSLPEALGELLSAKHLHITTAESCTGGYLAHLITSIPGASEYYEGGQITYSNRLKMEELGVEPETLQQHGAVSESTVLEMLEGILRKTGADVGIAVSGIMGPGGGTPEKPVGTVWIGYGSKADCRAIKLRLGKDRLKNIEYTAYAALNRLRLFLLENTEE